MGSELQHDMLCNIPCPSYNSPLGSHCHVLRSVIPARLMLAATLSIVMGLSNVREIQLFGLWKARL